MAAPHPSAKTWDTYVEEHLMREENGHQLTAAAVIGPGEVIWARSDDFPSVPEITSINKEFNHPGALAAGLSFAGTTYMDIRHVGQSVIRARINPASSTGITIVKTHTTLLIGMYDENPEECSIIVENVGTYLTNKGH